MIYSDAFYLYVQLYMLSCKE